MKKIDDLVSYNTIAHMPNIAAIDLGTNSCRLLIAATNVVNLHRNFFNPHAAESSPFKVINSFSRVLGLGEGLKQTGELSKSAIDKTIETLRICKTKMEENHVYKTRAVATEACRKANNAHVLIDRAMNELSLNIEIITPQEEAQLVLKGCMSELSDDYPYGIAIDIGGGSTEFIWLRIKNNKASAKPSISIIDSMSLPYGVVTLRDTHNHEKSAQTYVAAQQAISQAVKFFTIKNGIEARIKKKEVQIIASSGTVTTLAFFALGLKSYDRKKINGNDFNSSDLQRVGNTLLSQYLNNFSSDFFTKYDKKLLVDRIVDHDMPEKDREDFLHTRIGLLAAGTVIFNSIVDIIGQHVLRIADSGVREGILHELIEKLKYSQGYT
jgi:exopolyphosphatase/guanosine-5'-triphosphate,3'-diphosphate pyrophosphatase